MHFNVILLEAPNVEGSGSFMDRDLDTEAFIRAYQLCYTRLRAFVQASVPPDVVDDILQETCCAALMSLHEFKGDSSFCTWLRGIAHHKIVDYYRRQDRQGKQLNYGLRLISSGTSANVGLQEASMVVIVKYDTGLFHFFIFNEIGLKVVDLMETALVGKRHAIEMLRRMLESLWNQRELEGDQKRSVVRKVAAIVGYTQQNCECEDEPGSLSDKEALENYLEQPVVKEALLEFLRECIAELDPDCKLVINLSLFGHKDGKRDNADEREMADREIADILKEPRGTVAARLYRCKLKLDRCVKSKWDDYNKN